MKQTSNKMRVFIIECPDPMDLLQERSEGQGLEKICKLVGHEVASFQVKSKFELESVCEYISSIDKTHDDRNMPDLPLCIHITSHGNDDGLGFGKDFVTWDDLLEIIRPICTRQRKYRGDRIFVISACEAKYQQLTNELKKAWEKKRRFKPPKYLFLTADDEVFWDDAIVAWAMFYNKMPKADLNDKYAVQEILDQIKKADVGTIYYYRWDSNQEKYLRYHPKVNS